MGQDDIESRLMTSESNATPAILVSSKIAEHAMYFLPPELPPDTTNREGIGKYIATGKSAQSQEF
jgi:hypothetical protein